jgi:hypothetical protein
MAIEYNAIVFTGNPRIGNAGYMKYRKINNQKRFITFITAKYPNWRFVTWYNRANNFKTIQKR